MKKILFFQILLILFSVSIYAQKTPNEKFAGVFQSCAYHCSTYYIFSDFTFRHKFIDEVNGTWKLLGKNRIKFYAPGKKAETAFLNVKNNDGEIVKVKLKIPKIKAFKRVLFFENGFLCALYNKGKSKTCYQKIETDLPDD